MRHASLAILGIVSLLIAGGTSAVAQPKVAPRFAVVACYGGAEWCPEIRDLLASPKCDPKITVLQAPANASPAALKAFVEKNAVPKGTPLFLAGHGVSRVESPKNFTEASKGKRAHHLGTGGYEVFENDDSRLSVPKGVSTQKVLDALPYAKYGLPIWGSSCGFGEVCGTKGACVGGNCQKDQVASYVDRLDNPTEDIIRLYCQRAEFDKADRFDKQDGVVTGKELTEYMRAHCSGTRPKIEFFPSLKGFDDNLAAIKQITELAVKEIYNGSLSEEDRAKWAKLKKGNNEGGDTVYAQEMVVNRFWNKVKYAIDTVDPDRNRLTAKQIIEKLKWTPVASRHRFSIKGEPLDRLVEVELPAPGGAACYYVNSSSGMRAFQPHVANFNLRFLPEAAAPALPKAAPAAPPGPGEQQTSVVWSETH